MNLSIDIGSKYIYMVLGEGASPIKLFKAIKILTPLNSYLKGQLVNIPAIAESIQSALTENQISCKSLTFCINSPAIVSREMVVPKLKPSELTVVVQNEMIQVMGGSSKKTLVDYIISDVIEQDGGEAYKIIVTAVPEELVGSYVELASILNIKIKFIDLTTNTLCKVGITDNVFPDAPYIMAHIGQNSLIINLIDGDKKLFSRSIIINNDFMRNELFNNQYIPLLDSDFINLNLSPSNLELDQLLQNITQPYLSNVADNISKIMQFQTSKNNQRPIEKIFISGGLANIAGLDSSLTNSLNIPVAVYQNPTFVKADFDYNFFEYIGAIGALIRI